MRISINISLIFIVVILLFSIMFTKIGCASSYFYQEVKIDFGTVEINSTQLEEKNSEKTE